MAGNVYRQYVWLLDLINRHDGISKADINDRWQRCSLNETGERLPPRTLYNHLQKIYEIFGIRIASINGYMRIVDSGDIDLGNTQQSLLAHLQLSNALLSNPEIAKRISLDGYMSFRYFTPLFSAMEEGKVVELHFWKRDKSDHKYLKVEPYYIKQFEGEWFMVGRNMESRAICAYAFRHIIAIRDSEADERFEMPKDFNVAEFMRNPQLGVDDNNSNDLYMEFHTEANSRIRRNRWGSYIPEGMM